MENSNSKDFLSLSLSGNSSSTKRKRSPSMEAPQETHRPTHVPVMSPLLAPYSPWNNNNSTENNDGEVHVNGPVTALLLTTSPVLAPYAASSSSSNNNNSDNYGGDRVHENAPVRALSRPRRSRAVQGTIVPPFPWATDQRARIHSFKYLVQNKITRITGSVQCKRCLNVFEMELDLVKKLDELLRFIKKEKHTMNDRAPKDWMDPVLPNCEHCERENSVAPLLAGIKKKAINWLFLLLSQMLGCCTIKQLKYFCKHTKSHRTASKDHLVYSTFEGLWQQLLPENFDY